MPDFKVVKEYQYVVIVQDFEMLIFSTIMGLAHSSLQVWWVKVKQFENLPETKMVELNCLKVDPQCIGLNLYSCEVLRWLQVQLGSQYKIKEEPIFLHHFRHIQGSRFHISTSFVWLPFILYCSLEALSNELRKCEM